KRQQPIRHIQAERLGGLEIDDQLEFRLLYDREINGLFTLENAAGVKSDLSPFLYQACSVTDEPTRHDELTKCVHSRNCVVCRKFNEPLDPIVKKKIRTTNSAPVCAWTRLTKAASISRSLLAFNIWTFTPTTGAAASTSFVVSSDTGLFGFSRKPIVAVPGTNSCNSASTLAPSSPVNALKPVRLPPGRLRLATSPS